MKKLNMCQTMIALGINALIEDGCLAEVNADENTLNTASAEFYSDADAVDLSDEIKIIDIDGHGFAMVAASDMTGSAVDEGANGLIVETKADEPGLFWHEQIYNGDEEWVDAEE